MRERERRRGRKTLRGIGKKSVLASLLAWLAAGVVIIVTLVVRALAVRRLATVLQPKHITDLVHILVGVLFVHQHQVLNQSCKGVSAMRVNMKMFMHCTD